MKTQGKRAHILTALINLVGYTLPISCFHLTMPGELVIGSSIREIVAD